jgi:XTP/dITP diphosphohydrolase
VRAPVKLYLASGNPGKLAEFRGLTAMTSSSLPIELELLPGFDALPPFEENAPTFAENAAGKALHYSRLHEGLVFADDSGLVVPALEDAPGVHSARYAGPHATNSQRIEKLLREMQNKMASDRAAYFICLIVVAENGRVVAAVSDRVKGEILNQPRGLGGFGYDSVFYFPALKRSFAELSAVEKNQFSHRGKAFRRLLAALSSML